MPCCGQLACTPASFSREDAWSPGCCLTAPAWVEALCSHTPASSHWPLALPGRHGCGAGALTGWGRDCGGSGPAPPARWLHPPHLGPPAPPLGPRRTPCQPSAPVRPGKGWLGNQVPRLWAVGGVPAMSPWGPGNGKGTALHQWWSCLGTPPGLQEAQGRVHHHLQTRS